MLFSAALGADTLNPVCVFEGVCVFACARVSVTDIYVLKPRLSSGAGARKFGEIQTPSQSQFLCLQKLLACLRNVKTTSGGVVLTGSATHKGIALFSPLGIKTG